MRSFCWTSGLHRRAPARVRGADDVIAYHLRQSFVPGEITPEEANRLGVELARRFTKDKHAFIVCTHIDKGAYSQPHHLELDGTLECDRKFRNFWGSTSAVDRLSDTICVENGLLHCGELPSPTERATTSGWVNSQALPPGAAAGEALTGHWSRNRPDLDDTAATVAEDGLRGSRRGKASP